MILRRKLVFLAISSLSIQSCFAANPVVVQTDIVFPRNNTVYKAVPSFPIVFALINFADIWQYQPIVAWRLHILQPNGNYLLGERGVVGWTYKTSYQIAPGPQLAVNSASSIKSKGPA